MGEAAVHATVPELQDGWMDVHMTCNLLHVAQAPHHANRTLLTVGLVLLLLLLLTLKKLAWTATKVAAPDMLNGRCC